MRYERKAVVSGNDIGLIHASVLKHPLVFQKQFPDRTVNSIYLDTADFESLQMNLQGVSTREKWRMRWYGKEERQVSLTLERKWKQNMLGGKELTSLGKFAQSDWLSAFEKSKSKVSHVFPIVKVSYDRQYYISVDRQLRLTIDTAIHYQKIQDQELVYPTINDPKIVVEFKYNQQYDSESAIEAISKFPFRITKNSKYVNAMKTHWF